MWMIRKTFKWYASTIFNYCRAVFEDNKTEKEIIKEYG